MFPDRPNYFPEYKAWKSLEKQILKSQIFRRTTKQKQKYCCRRVWCNMGLKAWYTNQKPIRQLILLTETSLKCSHPSCLADNGKFQWFVLGLLALLCLPSHHLKWCLRSEEVVQLVLSLASLGLWWFDDLCKLTGQILSREDCFLHPTRMYFVFLLVFKSFFVYLMKIRDLNLYSPYKYATRITWIPEYMLSQQHYLYSKVVHNIKYWAPNLVSKNI